MSGTRRDCEEVLEVELPSGMQPTADDVDHRHRQRDRLPAGKAAPERDPVASGGARATVRETARIALAPSRDLSRVPSSSIKVPSIAR